jgi:hypothetical protein
MNMKYEYKNWTLSLLLASKLEKRCNVNVSQITKVVIQTKH